MIFAETNLKGVYLIEPEQMGDDRGFFARTWCQKEFSEHGLNARLVQCNVSFNRRKGTLRGMHFQIPPFQEAKLVRCTRGAIYDVAIDLRRNSPTFKKYVAKILSFDNYKMMYIPEGFAHGFQTLTNETEVFYQMSEVYSRDHAKGVRWNDPSFGIEWPDDDRIILDRDKNYPDFEVQEITL
jgi:dTDP-4-dehydrorhamnose 3,5-epimerase